MRFLTQNDYDNENSKTLMNTSTKTYTHKYNYIKQKILNFVLFDIYSILEPYELSDKNIFGVLKLMSCAKKVDTALAPNQDVGHIYVVYKLQLVQYSTQKNVFNKLERDSKLVSTN